MSLSEGGMWTWITKSNQFNEQKFAQDMEKITNYYQNNGYFNFRILDTDIQTNEDKTKQTIKVTVSEGDRFRWGNVRIEGDTLEVPKEDLEKLLTMKPGNGTSARKCLIRSKPSKIAWVRQVTHSAKSMSNRFQMPKRILLILC